MSKHTFLESIDSFSLFIVTSEKDLTPREPLKLVWILPSGQPFNAQNHDMDNMTLFLTNGTITPTVDEVDIPGTDMRGRQVVRAEAPASTPL